MRERLGRATTNLTGSIRKATQAWRLLLLRRSGLSRLRFPSSLLCRCLWLFSFLECSFLQHVLREVGVPR
ncbi:hypothetical protein F751_1089 [Auxenochlorella protothecoides]|uniref:Uncharacterized protein n=1 Tax=Auxenochlorella protothecoides TaxID=3075 RepID=A0A087SCD9_AUXPR|nr:hypothetical protein F751_1089 [Auxenochlorella protothecoides]KFM23393.1 hypothetical protein F751_1089 [Auxenochlorella protothecoides]